MKLFLIAYDIADDAIRDKVARRLLREGKRVQESVFEIVVRNDAAFARLTRDLCKLCPAPFAGQIRWYGLNRDAYAVAGAIGVEAPSLPASVVVA